MVTLIARLCALCAVCALMQMISAKKTQGPIRMIGGLLMLHLVLSGIRSITQQVLNAQHLTHIFEILMQ